MDPDKTNLPFDIDEPYKTCYEGQPSSEANALKTPRCNNQNPTKLVATALRKMNEDKENVAKLAPVAQFTTNNSAWQKLKPETLEESKIARQLGVIDKAMVNVATSKRVLEDVLTDEITLARPSGGLLTVYAQLLRDADKKSLALEAAQLQTDKLRRARREAIEQKERAEAAEAEAAAAAHSSQRRRRRRGRRWREFHGGRDDARQWQWSEERGPEGRTRWALPCQTSRVQRGGHRRLCAVLGRLRPAGGELVGCHEPRAR